MDVPPPDRGLRAWALLFGCVIVEGLVWGFPFAYGVFYEYYTNHKPFSAKPDGLGSVGTVQTGVAYFASPILFIFIEKYMPYRRRLTWAGLLMIIVSLIAASFATKVVHLILTQGVLYGLGCGMLYAPVFSFIDSWFDKRKGLAFGVMWAGTGAGGLIVPFTSTWLLDSYGFRAALRIWAVVFVIAIAPMLFVIKARIPSPRGRRSVSVDMSFALTTPFLLLSAGNILQGIGYFLPSIYLVNIASSLSLSSASSTLLLALLNVSAVVGNIVLGYMSDHTHVSIPITISALGTTVSTLLFWGLSGPKTESLLYVFAICYGVFAGGWTGTWPGCVQECRAKIRPAAGQASAGLIISFFAAGRGIGSVAGGPIGESLLDFSRGLKSVSLASSLYDSQFRSLVIFTAVTACLGGLGCTSRYTRSKPRGSGSSEQEIELPSH